MDGDRGGYHCTNIVETVCYIRVWFGEGVGVIMQSGISIQYLYCACDEYNDVNITSNKWQSKHAF